MKQHLYLLFSIGFLCVMIIRLKYILMKRLIWKKILCFCSKCNKLLWLHGVQNFFDTIFPAFPPTHVLRLHTISCVICTRISSWAASAYELSSLRTSLKAWAASSYLWRKKKGEEKKKYNELSPLAISGLNQSLGSFNVTLPGPVISHQLMFTATASQNKKSK